MSEKSVQGFELLWIFSHFHIFVSLVHVPVGSVSSAVGLNICAIIAGIKKYKSIIKKKKKKYHKIVLLPKTKLKTIKVVITKALIYSFINHEEFVSVNNVLREYDEEKEEIKNRETSMEDVNIWLI